MTVYCIVVHFGSKLLTSACLRSIDKSQKDSFVVNKLVVDNTKQNFGYAGGANRGIEQTLENSDTKLILLLNNDIVLQKFTLQHLLDVFQTKKVGVAGPREIFSEEPLMYLSEGKIDKNRFTAGHTIIKKGKRKDGIKEVDFISGSVMLIRKEVFKKIGFFDERYFLYYEDVDFCTRAIQAGYKCLCVPRAVVYHEESSSIYEGDKEYYLARNHLLFVEKHAPLRVKMREMMRVPKTVYEHLRKYNRGGKDALLGIKDYFLRRFGKRRI